MEGSPFTTVSACLVHDSFECTADLVRNLRFFEPDSRVIVYDGSGVSMPGHQAVYLEGLGAVMHPAPRPMTWGRLHDFVFDCLEYALDSYSFDALTFVDSDQLLAHRGYAKAVQVALEHQPQAGVLATPNRSIGEEWGTKLVPKERALWDPFLERFPSGHEQHYPRRWIYWPGTVITGAAGRAICKLRGDAGLVDILKRTSLASEEIAFSTLASLLGYDVVAHPWNDEWVRWRRPLRVSEVAAALADPTCYWLHPIRRHFDDPAREYLRRSSNQYQGFTPTPVKEAPARTSQSVATGSAATPWIRRAINGLRPAAGKAVPPHSD